MSYVTVDEVKLHAVIALDHDDFYIETEVIPAAEAMVRTYLDRPMQDLDTSGSPLPILPDIRAGILLCCAAYMEHREGGDPVLPGAAKAILWPHRRVAMA